MINVEVVAYNPQWKNDFDSLKKSIWQAVKIHAVGIEHVGSTSVEGLAAKPVIDIDIVVKDVERSSNASTALVSMGYRALGNRGLEGREAFAHPAGLPRHNLYVCIEGSEPLTNHLLVRSALRNNPQLVKEYSQLKLALAEEFPDDIDSYIDGKTDFLLGILANAGFSKEALQRAEAVNRKAKS